MEDYTAQQLLDAVEAAGVELPMVEAPKERRPDYVSTLTHNGLFTVKSIATGEHRTFKIATQKPDARFAPGKRVVSLLTGPDNTNNYTGFAFMDEFGVHVWAKMHTKRYVDLANMLEKLNEHEANGKVEVYVSTRCRVCNRTLTTPESVKSGIGPICAGRI